MVGVNKKLIVWAIIGNCVLFGLSVASLVICLTSFEQVLTMYNIPFAAVAVEEFNFSFVLEFVLDAIFMLASTICLIVYLSILKKRGVALRRLLSAALIFNCLVTLLWPSTILLFVAVFKFSYVSVSLPEKEVAEKFDEDDVSTFKKKVENLRSMKENGEITEEEYKEEIMKLL